MAFCLRHVGGLPAALGLALALSSCVQTDSLIEKVESTGGFDPPPSSGTANPPGNANPAPNPNPDPDPDPDPGTPPPPDPGPDITPPAVSISSPAAGTIAKNGLTLQGACENGLVVSLSGEGLSSPATTSCGSGSFSVAILFSEGDGTKNIIVSQTDLAGNVGSANRDFVRDTVPPALTISSPAEGTAAKTGVTLQGVCETGLSIALSGTGLSSPSSASCAAGAYSVDIVFAGDDGIKNIVVAQTDAAGNSTSLNRNFEKKSTAPAVTITSPAANTYANTGVTLQGNCEAGLAVSLSGTGHASPASTTCAAGTYSVDVLFTDGDGTKNIVVSQTDEVGNTGSVSRNFIRDSAVPNVSISSPAPDAKAKTGITLTGTCEDGLNVTVSGDGVGLPTAIACASGSFSQEITFTAGDGLKNIAVSQTSLSGNTGSTNRNFYRDNTPPNLTIDSPAANTRAKTGVTIIGECEFGTPITLSGAGLSSPASTACSASNSYSVAVTFTNGDGSKTITLTQTDGAANTASVSRVFVRDNVAPDVAIQSPASLTPGKEGLTLAGKCEVGPAVVLSGAGLGSPNSATCTGLFGCNVSGCPGEFSVAILFSSGDGMKPITVAQTDEATNSRSDTRSFIRDSTPPNVTIASPASNFATTGSLTITGACENSTGASDVIITGPLSGSPVSVSCVSSSYSRAITLTGSDGQKTVTVTQTDMVGNEGVTTRSFYLDANPPLISSVTPPVDAFYRLGDLLEFTVNFSENVTVSGTPRLALSIGGSPKYANYVSGSGSSSLLFRYTVAEGDQGNPGISLSSPVDLNSGAIGDGINQAVLTFSPPNLTNVKVDALPPIPATNVGWQQNSPFNSVNVTANWTKSSSSDLSAQRIQFYTGLCETTTGPTIELTVFDMTRAFEASEGVVSTFKIASLDAAGNETWSECSSAMVVDVTPPSFPDSVDDGNATASLTGSPLASWQEATDANGIASYEIAIGTSTSGAGLNDIKDWTDVGNVLVASVSGGFTLTQGTTYYTSVRARDSAGNVSLIRSGDGWQAYGDPVWSATATTVGVPSARFDHTAVWTGSQMIIWGGSVNTGSRYDPVSDSWSPTTTTLAPSARTAHTAVWTGSRMVIWGGSPLTNSGSRYDPVADSWEATATSGAAPTARMFHSAVWTGSKMIVWGGWNNSAVLSTGSVYDPVANSWTAMETAGAPDARERHSAIWTGSKMIVWGGNGLNPASYNSGGQYDPEGNSWTPISTLGAPQGTSHSSAVWTGSKMIVWGGGENGAAWHNTGGLYDPLADTWSAVTQEGAPAARWMHSTVWTGLEMVVFGGGTTSWSGSGTAYNDGGRYNPNTNTWVPTPASGTPPARHGHSAIFTGSKMIIWGGRNGGSFNTGGVLDFMY